MVWRTQKHCLVAGGGGLWGTVRVNTRLAIWVIRDILANQQTIIKKTEGYSMKALYSFLMIVAGIALVYSIMVFMPMLFTYLSNGSVRP